MNDSAARLTAGIILAGGQSRWMGLEKSLLPIGGVPLIARIASRLRPQVDHFAISANGDPRRFGIVEAPIIADPVFDCGPLGGILAGLRWAGSLSVGKLLTVACDTPFFPFDLAPRLRHAVEGNSERIAVAATNGRAHFTFALYPVGFADHLERWMSDQADRSIRGWLACHDVRDVAFEGESEPFFNINIPQDIAIAEAFTKRINS